MAGDLQMFENAVEFKACPGSHDTWRHRLANRR